MNYLLHILVLMEIYLILSLSLNLVVGYAGVLSLCHAAFYAVGAYVTALLMIRTEWFAGTREFVVLLPCAVLAAMLLARAVARPLFKLRGDYFALASIGLQTVVFVVLYNLTGVTGGAFGITDIPELNLLGPGVAAGDLPLVRGHAASFALFSTAFTALCVWVLRNIGRSPFGRALKAVREDELAAVSLGKDARGLKATAFTAAAGFAAAAGVLFTSYSHFVDPTSFTLMESVFILSILIVGGAGNFAGPVAGTALLILLPEALRFLRVPDEVAPNIRQIIDGALILLVVRFRPRGLAGEYRLG